MRVKWIAVIVLASAGVVACKSETQSAYASPDAQTTAQTASPTAAGAELASADGEVVKVYKDPNCGCCAKWVDHMRENGFTVETIDMPNLSMIKQKYGIGANLQSCHTSVIGDYTFEGHVPADVIRKMLDEKPDIAGLAVPGMPMGSPGMEGATRERYDVLTFDRAGRTSVYAQR